MQQEILKLQDEVDRSKNKLENDVGSRKEIKSELGTAQAKQQAAESQVRSLQDKLSEVRKELNSKVVECTANEQKLDLLQTDKDLLEKQLGLSDLALATKYKQYDKRIKEISTENDKILIHSENLNQYYTTMTKKQSIHLEEFKKVEQTVNNLSEKIIKIENSVQKIENESIKKIEKSVKQLEQTVTQDLIKEINDSKDKKQEMIAANNDLQVAWSDLHESVLSKFKKTNDELSEAKSKENDLWRQN